jgi:FSR family fosmidomycin resistance protein-like MFS transporter
MSSAWLVAIHAGDGKWSGVLTALLLFNVAAFALQPLWGLIADHWLLHRIMALAGLAVSALLLLLPLSNFWLLLVLQGCASAAFHVGAGGWIVSRTDKALPLGVFAAPGVMGLAIGVLGAQLTLPFAGPLALLLAIVAIFLLWGTNEKQAAERTPAVSQKSMLPSFSSFTALTGGSVILLVMLIALRSAVWLDWHARLQADAALLVSLVLAAALGKLLGGWSADRYGALRWSLTALALSAAFSALVVLHPAFVLPAAACLQSATPAMWRLLANVLPLSPGLSTGLALGLAIALGGLPLWLGWPGDGLVTLLWIAFALFTMCDLAGRRMATAKS